MSTTARIHEIAAIYIESAEAGQNFKVYGNHEELARHAELFKSADEKFGALIASDSSLFGCELRDIRYAITQGDFNDAKARFSVLAK